MKMLCHFHSLLIFLQLLIVLFELFAADGKLQLNRQNSVEHVPSHMAHQNPFIYGPESFKFGGSPRLLRWETDVAKAIDIINLPEKPKTFAIPFELSATDEPAPDKQMLDFLTMFILNTTRQSPQFFGVFLSCDIIGHRRLEKSGTIPRVLRLHFSSPECRDRILPKLTRFLEFMRNFCPKFSAFSDSNLQHFCVDCNGVHLRSLLPDQYKSMENPNEKRATTAHGFGNNLKKRGGNNIFYHGKAHRKNIDGGNLKSVQKFVELYQFQPPSPSSTNEEEGDQRHQQQQQIPSDYLRRQMMLCGGHGAYYPNVYDGKNFENPDC